MAQLLDIRVRKGAGRLHRINLALDRLRERQDPTTLRVVVQANLPRGQSRPSRLQYQRVGSYLIDCRTPEAVAHVRAELASLMHGMDKVSQERPQEPPNADLMRCHAEVKRPAMPPASPPAPSMSPDEYWHRYGHLPF